MPGVAKFFGPITSRSRPAPTVTVTVSHDPYLVRGEAQSIVGHLPKQTKVFKNAFKHTKFEKSGRFWFTIAVPDCDPKTLRYGTFNAFTRVFY